MSKVQDSQALNPKPQQFRGLWGLRLTRFDVGFNVDRLTVWGLGFRPAPSLNFPKP